MNTSINHIREWFSVWYTDHVARFRFFPWPEEGGEAAAIELETWRSCLVRNGFDFTVATETSLRLRDEAVTWEKFQHRFRMIGHDVCRERNANIFGSDTSDQGDQSRDQAEAASKTCPDCGGSGLATRFRHVPVGDGLGKNAVDSCHVLLCLCPMGRWMKKTHETTKKDPVRMPDLRDFPALQMRNVTNGFDNPNRHKRRYWDFETDQPWLYESNWRDDRKSGVVSVREILKQPPTANRAT